MVRTVVPDAPVAVAGLPPDEQSRILLVEYTDAMGWGATEAQMRQVLIDYVRRVREWYDRTH